MRLIFLIVVLCFVGCGDPLPIADNDPANYPSSPKSGEVGPACGPENGGRCLLGAWSCCLKGPCGGKAGDDPMLTEGRCIYWVGALQCIGEWDCLKGDRCSIGRCVKA